MKILISGYGRMGHCVEAELHRWGIDDVRWSEDVCATPPELARECVCIDFTTPDAFRANYAFIARHFKAAVVGTTGWNDIADAVFAAFREAGTPLVWASNFSLGVNALFAATRKVSALLKGAGYEAAIEEVHHVHKLDAPSGTAKSLKALVDEGLDTDTPIRSVREGEVMGIHTLTLTSPADRLTLRHEAFSREGLAAGAVTAALMTERLSGIHEFCELL